MAISLVVGFLLCRFSRRRGVRNDAIFGGALVPDLVFVRLLRDMVYLSDTVH